MGRLFFGLARFLFISFNIIVAALACILIQVSLSAFDPDFGLDTLNDNHPRAVHTYIAVICVGIGIIVALISVIGLYGSLKRSLPALNLYTGVLLFLISILLLIVLATYTMKAPERQLRDIDKNVVNSTTSGYNFTDSSDIRTRFIDFVQEKFHCCGLNSPNDWIEHSIKKIPKSCCSSHAFSQLPSYKYCVESEYKDGCWKSLPNHYKDNINSIRVNLYFLIGVCLFCLTEVFVMNRYIKRSAEVV